MTDFSKAEISDNIQVQTKQTLSTQCLGTGDHFPGHLNRTRWSRKRGQRHRRTNRSSLTDGPQSMARLS
ncbi:uncharacterized protein BDCG_16932 [Blastomyces dermatitidis ER-3]|uniref:Uncharacterized protein n=3 Tax=Blastomyces TaxID=229219 RepID=A0A179UAH2_BLAGS|nr:uncharacterized protein BDBG_16364 [Blastomyces gilchristii SLH14081]XP_045280878.1 uncharacterized protein BDCG_16932 [Blastomyces dermatitidis ER-3]EQL33482.1 hypothetical protein BDFG_04621 [Blastomyces dermatitidis ATCC 26199]KMW69372.1 hypothetical protein BDDG_13523 [Blastomyces dermatitidis ATCC 18188]OAT01151.1 hypothetical protein BDCG_16932 [Blastomyces dermatitidis ER-3]OAT04944.1 hypothetical protein BDBG_16364 [Blastomyces gilchristii SLH14081]